MLPRKDENDKSVPYSSGAVQDCSSSSTSIVRTVEYLRQKYSECEQIIQEEIDTARRDTEEMGVWVQTIQRQRESLCNAVSMVTAVEESAEKAGVREIEADRVDVITRVRIETDRLVDFKRGLLSSVIEPDEFGHYCSAREKDPEIQCELRVICKDAMKCVDQYVEFLKKLMKEKAFAIEQQKRVSQQPGERRSFWRAGKKMPVCPC